MSDTSTAFSLNLITQRIETGAVLSKNELAHVDIETLAAPKSAAERDNIMDIFKCFNEAINELRDDYGIDEWEELFVAEVKRLMLSTYDGTTVHESMMNFIVKLPMPEYSRYNRWIEFHRTFES